MCREVVRSPTETEVLRVRTYERVFEAVTYINDMQDHYQQINDSFVNEFIGILDEMNDLRSVRRRLFA
jgi:hypothetical protein